MTLRNSMLAIVSAAVLASAATARPIVSQLSSTEDFGLRAKDPAWGFDRFGADDFVLPVGNLRSHKVTRIEAIMIGDATPVPAQFVARIFRHNTSPLSAGGPGSLQAVRVGASSVQRIGPALTRPGYSKFLVTFNIPAGQVNLVINTRYWLDVHVRDPGATNWEFAINTSGVPSVASQRPYIWHGLIPAWGPTSLPGLAFRITTTQ